MLSAPLHFLAVIKALCLLQITGWGQRNGFSSEMKLRGASSGPCLDLFWYLRVMPQGVIASADWKPELLRMNAPSVVWRNSFNEKKALVLLNHRKVLILPWVSPALSSLEGMPAHQVRTHLPTVTWSPPLCSSQPRARATYWYPVRWLLIIFVCYHLSVPLPRKTDLHEGCISLWHKTVFSKYFLIE